MAEVLAPDPESFEPAPPERVALWRNFGRWEEPLFPQLVGLQVEEIRLDYCRMRLPYRPELNQPAGVVHGGALATLHVAAAGGTGQASLDANVSYIGAVRDGAAIVEGRILRRGGTIAFGEAEVRDEAGNLAAKGRVTYMILRPRT